jgi:hypothetical protein
MYVPPVEAGDGQQTLEHQPQADAACFAAVECQHARVHADDHLRPRTLWLH